MPYFLLMLFFVLPCFSFLGLDAEDSLLLNALYVDELHLIQSVGGPPAVIWVHLGWMLDVRQSTSKAAVC